MSRSRTPERYAGPSARVALLWLLAAVVAQSTVLHYAVVRNVEPSLILVVVVWYAMRSDISRATLFGLVAGIGEDLIAFDSGGAWTFATAITALLASLPTRRFFEDSMPFFMIVVGCATLVRDLVFWSIKKAEGYPAGLGTLHLHQAIFQGALNAVLAAVVMFVARRFDRRRAMAWRR
ncbi:MAG TPA: rod shape-determining protein MreD [Candidatus Dormibacteraeota bacterium]|nr:rod shape-determining protein MreD [Candidatus Dormibacteraeota bacterium]